MVDVVLQSIVVTLTPATGAAATVTLSPAVLPAGGEGGGAAGASAYDIAVSEGFVGTVDAWLASLVGAAGDAGSDGVNVTITVAADEAAFEAATPGAAELVVLYAEA